MNFKLTADGEVLMLNIILLAFLWAVLSTADAQSIGQIGASAAGGSAAGAAGQKVSDGFDRVMSKASSTLDGAAKTGQAKPSKKGRLAPIVPPEPGLGPAAATAKPAASTPVPARGATAARSKPAAKPIEAGPSERPSEVRPPQMRWSQAKLPAVLVNPAVSAQPRTLPPPAAVVKPQPVAVATQLPQVEIGESRNDVIGRLGKPAGKITSVDERGLVEVYSFRDGRTHAGSVRLINGKVSEVRLAQ